MIQLERTVSALDKHISVAVAWIAVRSGPHLELTSLHRMLLRVLTVALVLYRWLQGNSRILNMGCVWRDRETVPWSVYMCYLLMVTLFTVMYEFD